MPSDPNVLKEYVYELDLPSKKKSAFVPPPGVYKFRILEVEPVKYDDGNREGMRIYGKYDEYPDIITYFFISISQKMAWKIVNLFKSAGVFDRCIRDGKFYTQWTLLDNTYVYPVIDEKGIKNFTTEDKYLMSK